MQVLGATLGGKGRELSQLESQRQAAAVQKSRRISLLPVGLKLKSRLAATVLTPMAGWGQWICGRFPSQSECKSVFNFYNLSTKTKHFPKGRACPELKKIFGFGNTSDLGFYSLQRTLRASFLWHHFRSKTGSRYNGPRPLSGLLRLSCGRLAGQLQLQASRKGCEDVTLVSP